MFDFPKFGILDYFFYKEMPIGPADEMLVRITYKKTYSLNVHEQLSSGARRASTFT